MENLIAIVGLLSFIIIAIIIKFDEKRENEEEILWRCAKILWFYVQWIKPDYE